MTVEEAAQILSSMYRAGKTAAGGRATTAIHLFGVKYANELSSLPIREVVRLARISHTYNTEVYKGIRLAEYVDAVRDFP